MPTLYILYGSATGNAEGIAKDLADKPLPSHFTKVICKPLESFKRLEKEWIIPPPSDNKHGVIVVCSTTGNGDAPENASRFVRYIKRKQTVETMPFQHVAFSVLALGDTNYDVFCATGKLIDRKLRELGGTRASPLACADEATGLEDVVDPFMDDVMGVVAQACSSSSGGGGNSAAPPLVDDSEGAAGNSKEGIPSVSPVATPAAPIQQDVSEPSSPPPPAVPAVSTAPPPEKSSSPLYILYGSETGNAEQIAKDLANNYEQILQNPDAKLFFPEVICTDLDQFKKKKYVEAWATAPDGVGCGCKHGVLIVASTTGNGDPPENAGRFMRYIKRKQTLETMPFQHVAYAVLGLGDTNYDMFCNTGKNVDKRLAELGGRGIKPVATADEATGLEDVVEPWTNSILSEITNACRGQQSTTASAKQSPPANKTRTAASPPPKVINETPTEIEEEKKMDAQDSFPTQTSSDSRGVSMVRKLLSLDSHCRLPTIEAGNLPSACAIRISCTLHGVGGTTTSAEPMSLKDDISVASDDSEPETYTSTSPYEASVVGCRYLTQTCTNGALSITSNNNGSKLCATSDSFVKSQKFLDATFDLNSVDSATAALNGKRVLETTLALPKDGSFKYHPGDAIGVVASNTPEAVAFVLNMLLKNHGIQPTQQVTIDEEQPVLVEEAVRTNVDLCTPIKNKRILFSLSQIASDPEEALALKLLSCKTSSGCDTFSKYVCEQRRNVIDILKEFPSCQHISFETLLGILPPIPPRYYSICSSPLERSESDDEKRLSIAFAVVDYLTPSLWINGEEMGRRRIHGLTTSWLEAVCSPLLSGSSTKNQAPVIMTIFQKPTPGFRPPTDLTKPMILIGPGTGVAPFIGFLKHRRALLTGSQHQEQQQAIGEVDMYFGCRHADHDWLYKDEMKALEDKSVITNLFPAFSRDATSKKMYVQDMMKSNRECSSRIAEMLMHLNGMLYICGDGNHMAKDVQNSLAEILGAALGKEDHLEAGKAYIAELKKEGRFLLDIWS